MLCVRFHRWRLKLPAFDTVTSAGHTIDVIVRYQIKKRKNTEKLSKQENKLDIYPEDVWDWSRDKPVKMGIRERELAKKTKSVSLLPVSGSGTVDCGPDRGGSYLDPVAGLIVPVGVLGLDPTPLPFGTFRRVLVTVLVLAETELQNGVSVRFSARFPVWAIRAVPTSSGCDLAFRRRSNPETSWSRVWRAACCRSCSPACCCSWTPADCHLQDESGMRGRPARRRRLQTYPALD